MIKSGSTKLIFTFLDHTQAQINATERKRIEIFLRTFIPLFYTLNIVEFNMALVAQDTMDSDTSDADVTGAADYNEASSAASSSRTARNG